jgi:hypothetical protein
MPARCRHSPPTTTTTQVTARYGAGSTGVSVRWRSPGTPVLPGHWRPSAAPTPDRAQRARPSPPLSLARAHFPSPLSRARSLARAAGGFAVTPESARLARTFAGASLDDRRATRTRRRRRSRAGPSPHPCCGAPAAGSRDRREAGPPRRAAAARLDSFPRAVAAWALRSHRPAGRWLIR